VADRALYFPSIRVPETEWFMRVLLYWDSVGTIVPVEYLDDPKFLRPYTSGLRDHGLLMAVTPDQSIWTVKAGKYHEAFLALVDSLAAEKRAAARDRSETVRMHVDKTGFGLAYDLTTRGLATHFSGPEFDGWFDVEKWTADLFMAFLATVLGQHREQPMDPITDSVDCLNAFTALPTRERTLEGQLAPIRTEILSGVLPAPVDPVKPRELAEFKERHRPLLKGFRTAIEQCVVAAAAIDDPHLRARKVELIKAELKGQQEEITRRMEEQNWRRIGVGSLVGVAAAAVVVADAVVTGGSLTRAGASLGLASAVYIAFEGTRSPRQLLERPMAYAALAEGKFGDAARLPRG
jgi:hypothetical protein